VLLAGSRRLRGSGKVHVVDPFDCSGDAFPFRATKRLSGLLVADRQENTSRTTSVEVHQGRARAIAVDWVGPIDLLLLDGDHRLLHQRLLQLRNSFPIGPASHGI
jgi:hypothetical protein